MKLLSILCISGSLLLAGCGGSDGDGDGSSDDVLTGVFIDSAVEGISFATETQSGVTNNRGEFNYIAGESITFSIGSLSFPSIAASPLVSPLDMSPSNNINDNIVANTATLLQSLDLDANLENGILIPQGAALIATPTNLDVSPDQFSQDAGVVNLVANSGSNNVQLLDSNGAIEHLQNSIDNFGFEQLTSETISTIFDRQLFLFNGETQEENFFVVRNDGTFGGTWNDEPIAGTWEMRDGYWCRVLTEFFNQGSLGSEDCQLWELKDNKIRGTRDRGNGVSFIYNIVG